ncbi:hypothetical protein [Paenibacillus kandeliae]|uniref:hypothetical protein n=1 Tax=Paenibacillus kandeliae TaxID=3231269 RepID=UPI003457696D
MIKSFLSILSILLLWTILAPAAFANSTVTNDVYVSDYSASSYNSWGNYSILLNVEDGFYDGYKNAHGQTLVSVLFPIIRAELGYNIDFYDFDFLKDKQGNGQFRISLRVYDAPKIDTVLLRTRLNTIPWIANWFPVTPGKPLVQQVISIWR